MIKKDIAKTGYNLEGLDRLGINKEGRNSKTGAKDKRIIFAEEFIDSGKSIEEFAKYKGMTVVNLRIRLEAIRRSPYIKGRLDIALDKIADDANRTLQIAKQGLINGEIMPNQVKDINKILKMCSAEEKDKILGILAKQITSHTTSVFEYKDIFAIDKQGEELAKAVVEQIKLINKALNASGNKEYRVFSKDMYSEMSRMKTYILPYVAEQGEKIGYMAKPEDKEPTMFAITDEMRNMAREYLNANNEFICNKTMQKTLMGIVKGEINEDTIKKSQSQRESHKITEKEIGEATKDVSEAELAEIDGILHNIENAQREDGR